MEVTNDMAMTLQGIKGERLAAQLFRRRGFKCFQPDLMCKDERTGNWIVIEAKVKEKLWEDKRRPDDWYGTGLDVFQVPIRLSFQKDTGIRCKLVTFDSSTDYQKFTHGGREVEVLEGWLDELEASGDWTITKGEGTRNGKQKEVKIYNADLMTRCKMLYNPKEFTIKSTKL